MEQSKSEQLEAIKNKFTNLQLVIFEDRIRTSFLCYQNIHKGCTLSIFDSISIITKESNDMTHEELKKRMSRIFPAENILVTDNPQSIAITNDSVVISDFDMEDLGLQLNDTQNLLLNIRQLNPTMLILSSAHPAAGSFASESGIIFTQHKLNIGEIMFNEFLKRL